MSNSLPINYKQLFGSDPKIAQSVSEAWEIQTLVKDPSGWIDFTQSDVCIELSCVCGSLGHMDEKLPELVVCGDCHRRYFINGHVELIEVLQLDDPEYIGN